MRRSRRGMSRPRSRARAGLRARSLCEHDYAVVVGVEHRTGWELGTAERDHDADLAGACLATRLRVRAERLDPDRQLGERDDVADAAVDDDPRPAVRYRDLGDVVAEQRAREGAAAVDDEHTPVTRLRHLR